MTVRGISLLLAVFVTGAQGLCAQSLTNRAAQREKYQGRLVEISSPQMEWGNEVPIILLTVTNLDRKAHTQEMGYKWYGPTMDIFGTYHNGKHLFNPLAFTLYGFDKMTVLARGEKVTFAFRLSLYATLPETRGKKELLQVKIETFAGRAVLGPPIHVWIGGTEPESPLPFQKIRDDKDLQEALVIVKHSRFCPQDKLRVLRMAKTWAEDEGKPDAFWKLMTATDDAYALVEVMKNLSPYLAKKDGLFALLRSNDLAVRRAALQTMAKLRPDAETATQLETFLKTQQDEPTLHYGKNALTKLQGRPP